MKHLPVLNKQTCCIALSAFVFGIAGAVYAQSGTSGQGVSGSSAGKSKNHGFSDNKGDQPSARSRGDRDTASGDSSGSMGTGSNARKDKSVGSSKPVNSGMESGGGAVSSSGSGSGSAPNGGMK
jgi:hypothetical protein